MTFKKSGEWRIKIYNIVGELIVESGECKDEFVWKPISCASGIYLYIITGNSEKITGKIAIIR
ncbi:T9SS type A sorting domain-containing protein [Candidatus Desantisbacteria bacterium]|nr:T9SS type A sorting domain-containing protein [Candidatus Desantisbacteria bacterium]